MTADPYTDADLDKLAGMAADELLEPIAARLLATVDALKYRFDELSAHHVMTETQRNAAIDRAEAAEAERDRMREALQLLWDNWPHGLTKAQQDQIIAALEGKP